MSLYESLDRFVGAGLLACAPAVGVEAPTGAIAAGGEFAVMLRGRGEAAQLGQILDAFAQEIWLGQDTNGIPHQVSEQHTTALVDVLDLCRPGAQEVAAAVEKSRSGLAGHANGAEPAHRRIAADVIARANQAGLLAKAGLWEEVALHLLERLFAHILDDPRLLPGLRPAFVAFLGAAAAPADAGQQRPGAGATAAVAPHRNAAPSPDPAASLGLSEAEIGIFSGRGEIAALAAVQQRYGLSEQALRRFLAILTAQRVPAGQMLVKLEDMALWLKATRDQLTRASNDEADVRRLKARAALLLADGDFEQARDVLKQVRRRVREGRRRIEERLQEDLASLRAQLAEESGATARLAELALARFDFDQAAELFADAADGCPKSDRDGIWRYTMRQAEALYRKGDERGDDAALLEASQVFVAASRLAAQGETSPAAAIALIGHGNALYRLGEREGGTGRLREAIAAFRKALPALPRSAEPRRWALLHMHLGNALATIAEREPGAQGFAEAAAAYREALKELSHGRAPLDWAMTEAGLGNALVGQEERAGGLHLLEEAVAAFHEAHKVLTRERMPVAWATTQMNLGSALLGLGEAEASSGRLEEAAIAYREALKVFTREQHAVQWSLARMNLGNALASLGDREPAATIRLDEAVKCYQEALEVCDRVGTPLRWAITQMNLGTVLIRLGERRDKRRNWLAAAAAMVPALEVFEAAGARDYVELTRRNLRKLHDSWEAILTGAGRAAE